MKSLTPHIEGVEIFCCEAEELLEAVEVDALITDPPYSSRTHAGHDATANGHNGSGSDSSNRNELGYAAWEPDDVRFFVRAIRCRGWVVCFTDHTLAPEYIKSLSSQGRYVFAPLPYYAPGSRVRLSGDGPSSWTDWIIVSRTARQKTWGTLPGGYVRQSGWKPHEHMGGKPVELMIEIVRDYSFVEDLVCDPCLGSGTTAIACMRTGRKFIGCDISEEYCNIAVERVEKEAARYALFPNEPKLTQKSLI